VSALRCLAHVHRHAIGLSGCAVLVRHRQQPSERCSHWAPTAFKPFPARGTQRVIENWKRSSKGLRLLRFVCDTPGRDGHRRCWQHVRRWRKPIVLWEPRCSQGEFDLPRGPWRRWLAAMACCQSPRSAGRRTMPAVLPALAGRAGRWRTPGRVNRPNIFPRSSRIRH